jgi:hypothetical protein
MNKLLEFSLFCHFGNASATLCRGVERWLFSSVGAARQFATTLVSLDTKLVVYDADGNVILNTLVYPA